MRWSAQKCSHASSDGLLVACPWLMISRFKNLGSPKTSNGGGFGRVNALIGGECNERKEVQLADTTPTRERRAQTDSGQSVQ